jgi:hypothetical protein
MEVLRGIESSWLNDNLSRFVDITPFSADLDSRKSFGKVKCQIKLRFDNDFP